MNYGNSDMAAKVAYAGYGSAASQGIGTGAVQGRQPELPNQIARLESAIGYVEESLLQLRDRLDNGSMRPEAPVPGTAGASQISAAPPSSGYANTIYLLADRVGNLGERVDGLLRRLEV